MPTVAQWLACAYGHCIAPPIPSLLQCAACCARWLTHIQDSQPLALQHALSYQLLYLRLQTSVVPARLRKFPRSLPQMPIDTSPSPPGNLHSSSVRIVGMSTPLGVPFTGMPGRLLEQKQLCLNCALRMVMTTKYADLPLNLM